MEKVNRCPCRCCCSGVHYHDDLQVVFQCKWGKDSSLLPFCSSLSHEDLKVHISYCFELASGSKLVGLKKLKKEGKERGVKQDACLASTFKLNFHAPNKLLVVGTKLDDLQAQVKKTEAMQKIAFLYDEEEEHEVICGEQERLIERSIVRGSWTSSRFQSRREDNSQLILQCEKAAYEGDLKLLEARQKEFTPNDIFTSQATFLRSTQCAEFAVKGNQVEIVDFCRRRHQFSEPRFLALLSLSAQLGRMRILSLLLDGTTRDLNASSSSRSFGIPSVSSPLSIAMQAALDAGQLRAVTFLSQRGGLLDAANALMVPCRKGFARCVAWCVGQGCEVSPRAFHCALTGEEVGSAGAGGEQGGWRQYVERVLLMRSHDAFRQADRPSSQNEMKRRASGRRNVLQFAIERLDGGNKNESLLLAVAENNLEWCEYLLGVAETGEAVADQAVEVAANADCDEELMLLLLQSLGARYYKEARAQGTSQILQYLASMHRPESPEAPAAAEATRPRPSSRLHPTQRALVSCANRSSSSLLEILLSSGANPCESVVMSCLSQAGKECISHALAALCEKEEVANFAARLLSKHLGLPKTLSEIIVGYTTGSEGNQFSWIARRNECFGSLVNPHEQPIEHLDADEVDDDHFLRNAEFGDDQQLFQANASSEVASQAFSESEGANLRNWTHYLSSSSKRVKTHETKRDDGDDS